MRIAMMGSGGIGGYIGAKLAQAGEDVTFIARGSHLAAMRDQGLCLESPLGGIKLPTSTLPTRPPRSASLMFGSACSRAGGIEIQIVDDIEHVLWVKFITISAFSGATSLMRCGIGRIFADPESQTFLEQLRDEGVAVAAAAGHPMAEGYETQAISLWKSLPAETQSSMAFDLGKGKPIEIAWLSGRIHTLGNELGVMTPAHTAVYRALHLHAAGTQRSQ